MLSSKNAPKTKSKQFKTTYLRMEENLWPQESLVANINGKFFL